MKKIISYITILFIDINIIFPQSFNEIKIDIKNKIETVSKQLESIYNNDKMFHFIVAETELSKNKSYVSEIYFTKNKLFVEIENELKYIYIDDTFYEIKKNKKRIINNQKMINGAFISFWWDFINLDEINDINIINETILCI